MPFHPRAVPANPSSPARLGEELGDVPQKLRVCGPIRLLPWRAMEDRFKSAEKAFRLGFFGNTSLALLKILVGWAAGSRALLADGWHSLSDVLVNGGAWIAHRFSRQEPDEDHHFGHGKAEAFSGFTVGMILLVGGVLVIVSSLGSKANIDTGWKGWLALGVAALSILANVYLAVISRRAARAIDSHGLAALARDNTSDAMAGGLVVLGILGSRTGFDWAEPLVGIVIGILICVMGWRSARESFDVLMDRADPELRDRLARAAAAVEGVRGVQRIRVHPLGTGVVADMEIQVDGGLTVAEGHRIADSVEGEVAAVDDSVKDVHVHVEPWEEATP